MEREEILREIRELENHISESNLSASSVSAPSVYASSNTDEMVAILSEGQLLVPGQINSMKLITVFMRKMTPEEAQVERLRLAVDTVNRSTASSHRPRVLKPDITDIN